MFLLRAKDASAHDADRRARLHRALDCVLDRKVAKDGGKDYEVVWTDREYKEHRKVFKNDPQGAPDNASVDAHKYAKKLELAHNHSTYGSLRTLRVKAL